MADDHTRKYNDWHIQKPEPSHKVKRHNPNPVPPIQEEQQGADVSASNPFVQVEKVSQEAQIPSEDGNTAGAFTAPAEFTQSIPEQLPNTQSGQSTDADPETGLPIPEYLKPYTQAPDDNQE